MPKFLLIASSIIALFSVAFPIFLSEMIGGWTTKYTSPVSFTPSNIPDLSGKVAIITGANTGIGYHTALEMARKNCNVIVAARTEAKGMKAVESIKMETKNDNVQFLPLDLSSFKSVSNFVKLFNHLDLPLHSLILNAGVMKSPGEIFVGKAMNYGFETTTDGFEYHIGVNHIAHAYLTKLLLPNLKKSQSSRIVSVSSMAEQNAPDSGMKFEDWWVPKDGIMPADYEDGRAYGQSKLANLMYANQLAKHLNGTGVSVYSLHPGVILTELSRYMEPILLEDAKQQGAIGAFFFNLFGSLFQLANFDAKGGAYTQLYLATASESDLINGGFYHPIGRYTESSHPQGTNETLARMVWEETENAIKQTKNYKFSS